MAIVYRHIRLDKNEPFYIGIGKTEKRAYSNYKRNKYWCSIVSKTEYEVEILFEDLTWEKACEKEIELIQLYGRKDLGLGSLSNMTDGGDGANNMSKESIENMRQTKIGRKLSKEHIEIIRLSNLNNTYCLGKKRPEEVIEKIRQYRIGKTLSEESKNKVRQARLGKKMSEETKEKLSKTFFTKGQTAHNKGVPMSEEQKEKLRQSWIKRKEKQNNG